MNAAGNIRFSIADPLTSLFVKRQRSQHSGAVCPIQSCIDRRIVFAGARGDQRELHSAAIGLDQPAIVYPQLFRSRSDVCVKRPKVAAVYQQRTKFCMTIHDRISQLALQRPVEKQSASELDVVCLELFVQCRDCSRSDQNSLQFGGV